MKIVNPDRRPARRDIAVAALLGLASSGCVHEPIAPTPVTVSLQGGPPPTCADPLVRGFYDISLAVFANGPANVDLPSYEQKTFAYIRSIVKSDKDAAALIDHVKDIPRQVIQVVKEGPTVLDSCENFNLALSGPP